MTWGYSDIIEDGEGDIYLVQGRIDDPLTVIRSIEDVLECEKDAVYKALEADH